MRRLVPRITVGRREVTSTTPRTLLLTAHRRETQGPGMERICAAVLELLRRHADLRVVRIREAVK
jgi:UDP-N-acetylglucosamine 2-epimerase